jgi:anti-anti-sigma regulatory factor
VEQTQSTVSLRENRRGPSLKLQGSIGPALAGELHAAALSAAATGRDVSIDWRCARHLSAAALQVLLALSADLAGRGLRLRGGAPHPSALPALEMTGLNALIARPGRRRKNA